MIAAQPRYGWYNEGLSGATSLPHLERFGTYTLHGSSDPEPRTMEALTAIGLIANIVQFVDLGAKLINSAKEIQASTNGMTMENKNLEKVTTEMRKLTMEFNPLFMDAKSEDERAIGRLAQECRDLSEQILSLLKKITPTKPSSRRQIWGSTRRNQKYKREKKGLEEKLANCRGQLHLHFSRLTRSVNT